jgi:hypothetical protein
VNINDAFPSKYLKAGDIKGKPPVAVVISNVVMEEMPDGENKPVVYFQNKEKGVVLNKTNASMIAHSHSPDTDGWIGKTILLRCEAVPFGGRIVDSIRVSVNQAEAYAAEQAATAHTLDDGPQEDVPPPESDDDFSDDIPF